MKESRGMKLLSLVLAALLVLTVCMAGCSSAGNDSKAPASSAEKTDSKTTEDSQSNETNEEYAWGTLHGVTWSYGDTTKADETAKIKVQEDRNADYTAGTGNTREMSPFTYDYSAIGAMFEGGQIPTSFDVANSEPQKLIRNGWGRDITDCIKKAGIDLNDINPGLLSIYSDKDGKIYGLPKYAYTMGIYCHGGLFREAGLVNDDGSYKVPKTWDEVIEFGEIINEKTGKGGMCMTAIDTYGGWFFTAMGLSFGADFCIANDDGTYTARLNSPESIEAMMFYKKLFASKAMYGDPTIDSEEDCLAQYAAGNVAMMIRSMGTAEDLSDVNQYAMDPKDVILIPMPMSTSPDKYLLYTGGDGVWFAPNATDDQVVAALEFYMHYGYLSGWDEDIEKAQRAEWQAVLDNNGIILPNYPVFTDNSYEKKIELLKAEYQTNFDFDKQFGYFYERVGEATASYEEDGDPQNMFRICVSVLQELFVNPDADVAALMEEANTQYQDLLADFVS